MLQGDDIPPPEGVVGDEHARIGEARGLPRRLFAEMPQEAITQFGESSERAAK